MGMGRGAREQPHPTGVCGSPHRVIEALSRPRVKANGCAYGLIDATPGFAYGRSSSEGTSGLELCVSGSGGGWRRTVLAD